MPMGGLLAGVSEVKIRASVGFSNDSGGIVVQRAIAGIGYVSILVGVDASSVNRNPFIVDFIVTSDTVELSVSKALADLVHASDVATIAFDKTLADSASTSDSHALSVSKAFTEALTAADTSTRSTTKALADTVATSEALTLSTSKQLTEAASVLEGPYRAQDYVDPTYLAGDYVYTGAPVLFVDKALADLVSTAEFAAISVAKVLADSATAGDLGGTIRKTDYADIDYFAQDFVGTSMVF